MKAVIMAGGQGTRLRPLTSNLPKPMMPLANVPMMSHIVDLLKRHGIDDIVVTVAFMANAIQDYFGDGSEFGVKIEYAIEDTPLGTAGSVRNAAHLLDERFMVISGDVLTDIDLGAIIQSHDDRGAMATIGLTPVENPLEFGIVITNEDGRIERFLEKPTWGQVFSDTINTGIFVLEPEVFDYIAPNKSVDFSSEVFPAMLADEKPLFGAVAEGYWEDVGTLEAYVRAHKDILDRTVETRMLGFDLGSGVWLGEGAELHPDAIVEGPVVIGHGCRIEAGARLGPYSVLGANIRVRSDANIERCVVGDNSYLAESVQLRGAVLGRSCDLRRGARCDEGSVLGDEIFVGENASVGADVKIYPFKTVEAGAVVNSSLVWESKGARSLFGRDGVIGLANVDITPELATKVAMAFATGLNAGATIVTSRDSSRAARMLKRAVMAGLNAAGVHAMDLEMAPVPVTRFMTRRPSIAGGITVRLVEGDPQSVIIRFFDGNGADITESTQRGIERRFQREDFRRVFAGEIGDILFPARALEHYASALESAVDMSLIRSARPKIVVDYSYGSTSFVMPNVLSKLGAEVLAVNPYASTSGVVALDRAAQAAQVAELVRASGATVGGVFDPDGEHLTLIDGEGRVITDTQALLVFAELTCEHMDGDHIAVPIAATAAIERIAAKHGKSVIYTKMSTPSILEAATNESVVFAGSLDGGFVFPRFLAAYDAPAALVSLLELLARSSRTLASIVEGLPTVHMAHETVITPWEQKGAVMRSLMERSAGREVELIDGIRVRHGEGWALAMPDPSEPVTHVYAEDESDGAARQLAQEYVRRIRQMVR